MAGKSISLDVAQLPFIRPCNQIVVRASVIEQAKVLVPMEARMNERTSHQQEHGKRAASCCGASKPAKPQSEVAGSSHMKHPKTVGDASHRGCCCSHN
jgi:hypothetical protein